MAETPKFSPEQIQLIQSVLEQLAPGREEKPPVQKRGAKGRRYSRSEKAAILKDHEAGKSQSELFESYGVCRETLNRWIRRSRMEVGKKMSAPAIGAAAPTAINPPFSERATLVPVENAEDSHKGYHAHWREVLKTWRSRPGIGPAQVKNQLHRAGIKISVATARKIMEENGYTPPKPTVKEVEINRYEAIRPLELVHMDFKHFYINKHKVYLLLLQDDFSRFLCGHKITDSENMKAVIDAFEECVSRYGKMQSVMTDAGSAFYSWNGFNRFQKLITDEYGVDQIKASTPRSNGKVENVNKQIEKEVLLVDRYASLEEAAEAIREWIRFYNFERTHMGLPAGMVPADRFLFGWNTSASVKPEPMPKAKPVENQESATGREDAWSEVLRQALTHLKRGA
jgi:putative transposase